MFCIDEITQEAEILVVRCSGFFGRGSEGAGDGQRLRSSIKRWARDHPDAAASRLVIDFREVDYMWGDWPISALIHLIQEGQVTEIRYLASPDNHQALKGLVDVCNVPCFDVQLGPE